VLLPALVFVGGFRPGLAACLSNVCILGGALANLGTNLSRKQLDGTPLVNWDLILMMVRG